MKAKLLSWGQSLSLILLILTLMVPLPVKGVVADPRIWLFLVFLLALTRLPVPWKNKLEFFVKSLEAQLSIKRLWFLWAFLLTHTMIYKWFSWKSYEFSGADFSHFDYAIWNTIKGRFLEITVAEPNYYTNLLGNHFSPILILLSPLHMFVESHFWLPACQAVAASMGSLMIFLFSLRLFEKNDMGSPLAFSFLITTAYTFSQLHLQVFSYEFHHEIFYLPLLVAVCYQLEFFKPSAFQHVTFWGVFLLTLFVKEDSAIVLMGVFMFYVVKKQGWPRYYSTLGLIICPLYFYMTQKVWMPQFISDNSKSSFLFLWQKYGTSSSEILNSAVSHPHWVLMDIFSAKSFYKVYVPWLFLPFLSFAFVLPLASLATLLTTTALAKDLSVYYPVTIISLTVIGVLYALVKIKSLQKISVLVMLCLSLQLLLGIGSYSIATPKENGDLISLDMQSYLFKTPITKKRIFISGNLLPHAPYRQDLLRIWTVDQVRAQLSQISGLFIAKKVSSFPVTKPEIESLISWMRTQTQFEIVLENNDLIIFRRKADTL